MRSIDVDVALFVAFWSEVFYQPPVGEIGVVNGRWPDMMGVFTITEIPSVVNSSERLPLKELWY